MMEMKERCKSIGLQLKLEMKSEKNIKKQQKRVMKTGLDGALLKMIVTVPTFNYLAYSTSNKEGENFELVVTWRFQCASFGNWRKPCRGDWNMVAGRTTAMV